jgi:hypothetical protein
VTASIADAAEDRAEALAAMRDQSRETQTEGTSMAVRAFGRQWVEITDDTPATNQLTYTCDEDDEQPGRDELAARRGRRPGRPTTPLITACEERPNDD